MDYSESNNNLEWRPAGDMGKEVLTKWNKPYVYQEFPKMLYRAQKKNGKTTCMTAAPRAFDFPPSQEGQAMYQQAMNETEMFNQSCTCVVNDAHEETAALERGFRRSAAEAMELMEQKDTKIANQAAERHYSDSKMSEKAQLEAKAHDDATGEHVPSLPEAPIKRRGGRPKGSKNRAKAEVAN